MQVLYTRLFTIQKDNVGKKINMKDCVNNETVHIDLDVNFRYLSAESHEK